MENKELQRLELNEEELDRVSGGLSPESIDDMSLPDADNLQKPAQLLNHALPYGLVYEQMASDNSGKL